MEILYDKIVREIIFCMAIKHTYNGKYLKLHKAYKTPSWGKDTVLVTDTWDYVSLWLKRENKPEAQFYWEQAKSFFEATQSLPKTSAPLTTVFLTQQNAY